MLDHFEGMSSIKSQWGRASVKSWNISVATVTEHIIAFEQTSEAQLVAPKMRTARRTFEDAPKLEHSFWFAFFQVPVFGMHGYACG